MGRLHGPVVGGVVQVDQRVKFTREVQSGLFYPWGNVWYVDGDNGNVGYSGRGPSDSKALPSEAIGVATDNDFIYLKAADYTESAELVLSLYDVQIVGVAPTPMQPNLNIYMAYGAGFSPQITVSGRGNSFYNMCFRHGAPTTDGGQTGNAGDLIAMEVSGRYNYFENVYFYSPMYSEQNVANTDVGDNDGYCGVVVSGHNNYFRGCKFGSDGLARSGLNFNVLLNGGVGNIFEDCLLQMTASADTPSFVGINSIPRDMKATLFKNCTFYAHSGNYATAVADAFKHRLAGASPTGNTAGIILQGCNFVNVEEISDTASDLWIWREVPGSTTTITNADVALRSQGA